jgi:hypothetical protein
MVLTLLIITVIPFPHCELFLAFFEFLVGFCTCSFESTNFLLDLSLGFNALSPECKNFSLNPLRAFGPDNSLYQFLDLDLLFVIIGALFANCLEVLSAPFDLQTICRRYDVLKDFMMTIAVSHISR